MPAEHGGWGLLAEPVLLGLALAASTAGACLAAAAFLAFLSRHPLRLWLMDLRRGARYPRTALALRFFLAEALAAAGLLATAVALAEAPFLAAVAAAAPFALAALAYDALGRGRDAVAESCGAVALSASAATIAMAGGAPAAVSFAASALLAVRGLTSVLYIRARIRLDRGLASAPVAALGAHAAALALAALLVRTGLAPLLGALAFLVLLARAAHGLSRFRPALRPQQLGVWELGYGLLTLALLAVGFRTGI